GLARNPAPARARSSRDGRWPGAAVDSMPGIGSSRTQDTTRAPIRHGASSGAPWNNTANDRPTRRPDGEADGTSELLQDGTGRGWPSGRLGALLDTRAPDTRGRRTLDEDGVRSDGEVRAQGERGPVP